MSFARPLLLLLLVLPAVLTVVWVVVAKKRSDFALRLADASLFEGMVTKRPGWRQAIPGVSLLLAACLVIISAAGPQQEIYEDVESSTVVLVFDISMSMLADDVDPDRLTVAKEAAKSFIDTLPDHVRLGLVTFNQTVTPAINPRTSREEVTRALVEAQADYGTAMGDAINAAVSMIKADYQSRKIEGSKGAAIVVLGDGDTTVGNPSAWGAQQAKAAEIPVSTIVFGTANGIIEVDGAFYEAPAAPQELRAVAQVTGGEFFESADSGSLTSVFERLGKTAGKELVFKEVTWPWLLAALCLMLLAFGLNLVWVRRLL